MLNQDLTHSELKELGAFLAKHKGAMSLTAVHGFLYAIVSSPRLILPSEWQSYIFGDADVVFDSQTEAENMIALILRFHNHIIHQLTGEMPCEPLIYEAGELIPYETANDDQLATWCSAYIDGTRFDETWKDSEQAIALLFPMAILANQMSLIGEKDREGNIIQNDETYRATYRQHLPEYIQELYQFWLAKRRYSANANDARGGWVKRQDPKPGRNDLCSCGSGKKYKKCCLNEENITYH